MPSGAGNESLLSFGMALRGWRERRGMRLRRLAQLVNYSPGHLSKVEHGTKPPTEELAKACDAVLDAGGELAGLVPRRSGWSARLLTPAQLPAGAAAGFVGRDDPLRRLDELLSGEPDAVVLAAIDGPPGVGKTALALRWAHHAAGRFSDGQLYADLRGYGPDGVPARPEEVLEEFLVAFGVPADKIPVGLDRRAAMYRSVLADRRVLVVLDNAAGSQQVGSLLPGTAGTGAVVTSRNRLSGLAVRAGAQRVTLGPMPPGESVALLRRVIGDPRAEAEPVAVAALAVRCGHLPLALRVAAERVATRPHHAVADLVDELAEEGERLDLLATEDDATLAVRAAFSWSYHGLDPEVAAMFRLLGQHPGVGISSAAAAALAGRPLPKVRPWLEALTSAHLLEEVGRDWYRLHDLLREYAAERAVAEDGVAAREAAVRRLTDWYLHTARAVPPALLPHHPIFMPLDPPAEGVTPRALSDARAAREWCEAELGNIVPVTRLAMQHRLYGTAWKLPVLLWNFFARRRPWSVWIGSHRLAVEAAVAAGDRYGEAWALNNLAHAGPAEYRRSDTELHYLTRALEIRREIDDRWGLGWTQAALGYVARDRGEFEKAIEYYTAALPLFVEMDDWHGQAQILAAFGEAHLRLDRLERALPYLEQAVETARELKGSWIQGYTLVRYAEAQRRSGDPLRALNCLDQSVAVYRDAEDRGSEADSLDRRGRLLAELGRDADAVESFASAVRLYTELDDPRADAVRERLRRLAPEHDPTSPD
jgi:tetratricopeptide (TPR) repeat protein/transcriptional regulator with XRE-family HTH domain